MKPPAGLRACWVPVGGQGHAVPWAAPALDASGDMQRYSPLAMLRARRTPLPPMFIARMGKDDSYINGTVDAFTAEATRHEGPAIERVDYRQGVHAFDTTQDNDESREVIRRAIEFVKKHVSHD